MVSTGPLFICLFRSGMRWLIHAPEKSAGCLLHSYYQFLKICFSWAFLSPNLELAFSVLLSVSAIVWSVL